MIPGPLFPYGAKLAIWGRSKRLSVDRAVALRRNRKVSIGGAEKTIGEYSTMTGLTVSLRKMREVSSQKKRWLEFLAAQGLSGDEDIAVDLESILDACGVYYTLWIADRAAATNRIGRLFAVDCAIQALPVFEAVQPFDKRVRIALSEAKNAPSLANARTVRDAREARIKTKKDYENAIRRSEAGRGQFAPADNFCLAGAVWASESAQMAVTFDGPELETEAANMAVWALWAHSQGRVDREVIKDRQKERLRQYLIHGEAAADMPWPEVPDS